MDVVRLAGSVTALPPASVRAQPEVHVTPTSMVPPAAATVSRLLAGHPTYWICQVSGWSAWVLLRVLALVSFQEVTWRALVFQAICGPVGLGMSHLLRAVILKWEWRSLEWRPLLARLTLSAVVLSLAFTLMLWPLGLWAFREEMMDPAKAAGIFTVSLVNGTILFGCWALIYFGYHGWRAYQATRIDRLRLEWAVKEAELRALKSQINPHFLFNSLNTVRSLIDEDPARAREAVTQLANLLRSSLQAGQAETVPLVQEMQTVQSYLLLEQMRHEERLRVRTEIAPEALQAAVPPMLVQTLVENAVKYGISPRPEGGEVAVTARREDDVLALRVTNPGTIREGGRSTGLGLRNAAERLQLVFGAAATIRLFSSAADVVTAEVLIPWRPRKA